MLAAETELVAAVRALARERFAARAGEHDREASLPLENLRELQALGVAGLTLGKEWGGLGMGAAALVRVMEEIAYADASTAVALNMHLLGVGAVAGLPPFPRREVVLTDVGRNGALLCGPASVPSGGLDTRTSGYRARDEGDCLVLDGKAGFASMSDAATYVIVGGLVEGGNPADPSFVLALPRLDSPGVVNHHNWSAMGMRATASHDIECVGLRVPKSEALVAPLSLVRMVQAAQSVEVLQRRSWGALGILGLWLGLAQAAFDFTVEYLGKRYGFLAGAGLLAPETGLRADEGWAQSALGHMEHWLETGRIVLDDTLRRLETPFPSVQAFTRHIVRTVYHLRRMTEEVALGAMKLCGAHAYVTDRPMERIYRDLTGAIVMAWKTDQLQHMLGLGALGRPITFAGPAGS